jgi:hypothetical protein
VFTVRIHGRVIALAVASRVVDEELAPTKVLSRIAAAAFLWHVQETDAHAIASVGDRIVTGGAYSSRMPGAISLRKVMDPPSAIEGPVDQCKGTFELDTITPGPGLEQTNAYKYKQDSHICLGSKCADAYLGLNVGP